MKLTEPTEGLDAFENPIAVHDWVVYWTTRAHVRTPVLVLGQIVSFTPAGAPRVCDLETRSHRNETGARLRPDAHPVPRTHVARYGVPS